MMCLAHKSRDIITGFAVKSSFLLYSKKWMSRMFGKTFDHAVCLISSASQIHVVCNPGKRTPSDMSGINVTESPKPALPLLALAVHSPMPIKQGKVSRISLAHTEQPARALRERTSSARQFLSQVQLNSLQIPSQWPLNTTTTLTTSSGRLSVRAVHEFYFPARQEKRWKLKKLSLYEDRQEETCYVSERSKMHNSVR